MRKLRRELIGLAAFALIAVSFVTVFPQATRDIDAQVEKVGFKVGMGAILGTLSLYLDAVMATLGTLRPVKKP